MSENEPAFPRTPNVESTDMDAHEDQRGMTLRDYFAAKAMQASRSRYSLYATWDDLAKDAYEIAAAMLKERRKHEGGDRG